MTFRFHRTFKLVTKEVNHLFPYYAQCDLRLKIILHVTKICFLSRRTFQPFIIEWTISAVDSAQLRRNCCFAFLFNNKKLLIFFLLLNILNFVKIPFLHLCSSPTKQQYSNYKPKPDTQHL